MPLIVAFDKVTQELNNGVPNANPHQDDPFKDNTYQDHPNQEVLIKIEIIHIKIFLI